MIDSIFIDCPCCNKGVCIETKTEYITLWSCQTCGYKSTSRMISGSDIVEKEHVKYPYLIQDLRKEINNLVWYPSIVNIETKGMVFPDGTSKDDWKWASMLFVEVPEEEKYLFKNNTHKSDMSTLKHFDRLAFMDALEYIGFYKKLLNND